MLIIYIFRPNFFKIRSVWHIIEMMTLSSVSILPTVVLNVLILKPAMHTKSLGCQEEATTPAAGYQVGWLH